MSDRVKITGIMPVYNVLSGQYPFVECILLDLPLVDEMIIVNIGSDDGTLNVLERISSLNNKVKIHNVPFEKIENGRAYELIDKSFMDVVYNIASGDWIIAFHADEYYHPSEYDLIKQTVQKAHDEGYNSIRHSLYHISQLKQLFNHNWERIRIFKKIPNLLSRDAIDGFYVCNDRRNPEGFVQSYIPPELHNFSITSHHLGDLFVQGRIVTNIRHTEIFNCKDPSRLKHIERLKEQYKVNNLEETITKRFNASTNENDIHPRVPAIFHELAGKAQYGVRGQLYDLFKE